MAKKIETVLHDSQLGKILFRKNDRARRYIIRIKPDGVGVTIPKTGNLTEAKQFFQKNRLLVIKKQKDLAAQPPPVRNSGIDEAGLMKEARYTLPVLLTELARSHGFNYQSVQIRKSRTRWGSCSAKGTICLSLYLLLLPSHLITYVLLHELCHTVEMNHGPAFWALLDEHTNGQAKAFRKELKNYKTL